MSTMCYADSMMRIMSIVAARPNFVKLAAIHHACKGVPGIEHRIVHTGQHYDPLLSDVFFEQLEIPQPSFNLGVKGGSDRNAVIDATADAMMATLTEVQSDIVLVYGDVNGAVGAARAAKKCGIPIGHVEAGLRSGDLSMPEELNRIEIDRLADVLFCSEQSGVDHLQAEGVKGEIQFVGNTMIDTLMRMMPIIDTLPFPEIGIDPEKPFAVLTLHRPSNVDDRDTLLNLVSFLGRVNKEIPIVFPMHPRFHGMITKSDPEDTIVPLLRISRPIEPLGYLPFLKLMKSAAFILTDSGGIQEEAVMLGKRCFTLRRNTERPSTIESASNILIDPANPQDREAVLAYAKHPQPVAIKTPPLWDGRAGERILRILLDRFTK